MPFAWFLSCVLVAVYLWLLFTHSGNFPIHDDYHNTLQFLLAYQQVSNPAGLLELYLSRYEEQHQLMSSAMAHGYYQLLGMLDFRALVLAANAFVVGVFVLFGRLFRSPVLLLLAALLLFNAAYWNSSFWMSAAAAEFPMVFFGLATLMLLDRRGIGSYLLAMIMALACVLANGIGLGILLLGAVLLLLNGYRGVRVLLWLFWSSLVLLLFSGDYSNPAVLQAMILESNREETWALVSADPQEFSRWTLAVIGSGLTFGNRGMAMLAGGTLIAGWLFLLIKREDRRQPVAVLFATFLLSALCVDAFDRFLSAYSGLELNNQYAFSSIVLTLFVVAAFTRHCQAREIVMPAGTGVWGTLSLAALFCGYAWWWGLAYADTLVKPLHSNLLNWMQRADNRLYAVSASNPAGTLRQSLAAGVYSPFQALPAGAEPVSISPLGACDGTTLPAPTPPPTALLLRLDRAGLNNPRSSGVAICIDGKAYDLVFRQLPVYIRLPLPAQSQG